jgi:hypothetical protein
MTKLLLALAAFTFITPAMADSGEVPENFDEAILRESAADQGLDSPRSKANRKAEAADDAKDLPAGFEEAILNESAGDQGYERKEKAKAKSLKDPKEKSKKTQAKSKKHKPKEMKDLIAAFIKYNELRGDEQAESEDECAEMASSQEEFDACIEMLGLNRSVVSSRHVAGKKNPGRHNDGEHEKSSVDFAQ